MRDDNSKNKAIITPKNIFLPKVASLSDPKINNIESSNIATNVIGLTNRLYNSISKGSTLSV
jgi:hypothetical protein